MMVVTLFDCIMILLDFEKLGSEEWIVFRKKSYILEEFLYDWQTKLQKLEPTPLVTRILKEIHNYQVRTFLRLVIKRKTKNILGSVTHVKTGKGRGFY